MLNSSIEYYKSHGKMTYLGQYRHMAGNSSRTIHEIVDVVQNILIHRYWAKRYGVVDAEQRLHELNERTVEGKLGYLQSKGYASVTDKVLLTDRLISICRDFTVLAVSLCREAGIAARARCGFATYFEENKFVDHWILEYWNTDENRWIQVDLQLDAFQIDFLDIQFDTKDMPQDVFLMAHKAWQLCRKGGMDPVKFGILSYWGYDYIINNLMLDANALLKVPMHPWDKWNGFKSTPYAELGPQELAVLDELSDMINEVYRNWEKYVKYIHSTEGILMLDHNC